MTQPTMLCYAIHFPETDEIVTDLTGGPWVCWQESIADERAHEYAQKYPSREIAIMVWEEEIPKVFL